MNLSPCPHCQPYDEYTHIDDYINSLIGPVFSAVFPNINEHTTNWLWLRVLQLLSVIGVVNFVSDPNRSKLYNRGLIFFDEAVRRGIDIRVVTIFGQYVHEYVYKEAGKLRLFSQLPCPPPAADSRIDNKAWTKRTLKDAGIPVSEGQSFFSKQSGLHWAGCLGYPLAVKPTHGSLSKHVTVNIENKNKLNQAIDIAKQFSARYIVERHLPGSLYRATVVNQERVFVCQKRRPHVVGDGKHTIKQLIKRKNANDSRGHTNQKNTTLHVIDTDRARQFLAESTYNLASVPNLNEVVLLSNTYTLAAGCDVTECTESAHEDNVLMFRQAANVLSCGLVGFDVICDDITTSWQNQKFGIIEANTKPYIDMHAHPSEGVAQPVADVMWDMLDYQNATM
jgi:D-alanine-D-alanine ligase-like ATP-grasp enzyme